LRRKEEEEEEDKQRKREFKSDNIDLKTWKKYIFSILFFLLVESYKPHLSAHVDPTKLISVFQQQIYPNVQSSYAMSRLYPCLLLTPALHSIGKTKTSFGLCATDTFTFLIS
jgi:hypothetical protein